MARRKLSIGKRVNRYLKGDSLARLGRKKVKVVKRSTARAKKKATKAGIKAIKRTRKVAKKQLKKLPGRFNRLKKRLKKTAKSSRKFLKRMSKKSRRRSKKPSGRRSQRQEIRGKFDTSRSRIVQASGDPGASKPGEPPKMRTGEGRYSIKAEVRQRGKQIVSRTYVDKRIAGYMAMWEFRQDGKQRPFLKPGLMNNLPAFHTKVGAELKRAATAVPKRKAKVN